MLNIQENIPLAQKTTFQIGGDARNFVEVKDEHELKEALLWARSKEVPHVILAGGSNVLVPDDGVDALVIHIASSVSSTSGTVLTAQAGCTLLQLIRNSAVLGLGGWEKLAGIPGTLGGAVRGNAGAFGTEIKDVLQSVQAINVHTFERRVFTNSDCEFAYRSSFFKKHREWIIVSAELLLSRGDGRKFALEIEATIAEREKRHIQNVRAAGSYFMNPVAPQSIREQFEKEKGVTAREGRVPAGWLIEKAGLKGARVGGAVSSEQHPNYLVNADTATAKDVQELARKIKDAVFSEFGIALTEEAEVF